MKKNHDERVVTIDRDQYERLMRIAEQSVRDHGGNSDFDRIQRHVSKFNPHIPNGPAKAQLRSLRELRAVKRAVLLLAKQAGADGSKDVFYVTGQWMHRMGLYVPVRIMGRVHSSGRSYKKLARPQVAVKLHESVTPEFLEALERGRSYFNKDARDGDFLRPTYDSLVRFRWTQNQHIPSDPAVRKPIFAVDIGCLLKEPPQKAIRLTDRHQGPMADLIIGCYLEPVAGTRDMLYGPR